MAFGSAFCRFGGDCYWVSETEEGIRRSFSFLNSRSDKKKLIWFYL